MKYISLDIKSSGIDPENDQILEIGFVVDDLSKEVPLGWGRVVVCQDRIAGDPLALQMNSEILMEIHQNKDKLTQYVHASNHKFETHNTIYAKPHYVMSELQQMITKLYGVGALNLAGKNLASFDIPFLKHLEGFEYFKYHRRIIDPSIFYLEEKDEVVPNLSECLKRAEMEPANLHSAVGDSFDICRLIRFGMNKNVDIPTGFLAIKNE